MTMLRPRTSYLDELVRDIRHGWRQTVSKPGLPLVIVALLTLGIGVNTAIVAAVKAVVLEPLPFDTPGQIVALWGTDGRFQRLPASGPNFLDWRSQNESFEYLVADSPYSMNFSPGGDGEPEHLTGSSVTTGLFELLRVEPQLGRVFLPEEEELGARVVILSDALWKRQFASAPDVLGRRILLDGEDYTVVGVMPEGFTHPCAWSVGEPADIWRPLPAEQLEEGRDSNWLLVLGRVRDGVSLEAAQTELDVMARRLEESYPETNEGVGARLAPIKDELVGPAAEQLAVLLGAAALVLLIACGNVAGLLVARATARQTELAVRASLGAGPMRMACQSLAETLPLFLVGGAASVLFASWATRVLRATIPSTIPRVSEIGVDGWVAAWALGISLVAGLLFGLFAAWRASRTGTSASLRGTRGSLEGAGRARALARSALVIAQLAMTLVLANGAALMLQSYYRIWNRDHGFATEGVLTMRLNFRGPAYETPESVRDFYRRAREGLESLPGVRRAAGISRLPLGGGTNGTALIEGAEPSRDGDGPLAEVRVATPHYFETMGIPLLAGRDLVDRDASGAGGGGGSEVGVVINSALARKAWPGESALGKRLRFDGTPWLAVVGVAGDTRQWGLETEVQPEVYFPYVPWGSGRMFSFRRARFIVVRADLDPTSLIGPIMKVISELDPNLPLFDIRTTKGLVATSISRRRFHTILVGLFAVTAIFLAVTGIYSVMSFFVAQRIREIGIRMALGAKRSGVHRLVLGRGAGMAAVGLILGSLGVLATSRITESLLYGVTPAEPVTLAGGAISLLLISLLGAFLPSLRATRVNPVVALRTE